MAWRSPRPAAPISNPLAQLDASRKPEGGWRLLVTLQSREEILVSSATSPNFEFLAAHDPQLARLGAVAERYFRDDPNTSLIKLRQFGEVFAQLAAAKTGFLPCLARRRTRSAS